MIPTSALYKTPHLKAFNHFDTFNPNSINEAYLNKIVKFSKFKKIQLSNIIWFLIVAITIGLYTVSWIFWILFIIYRTVYINNYAKSKKIILDNLYKLPYDQLIMNIILAKIHGLYDLNSYTGWLGDTEYQYKNKEKILLLSIKVQSIDEINNIEGYEQLKTKVKEKYFKKGEKIMLFREYLASTNLACAKIAFDTDTDKTIETVVINMYFDGHDNNTGHEKRYFISSVQINREIFQKINLEHVSPIHCIRNFAGRIIDSEQK